MNEVINVINLGPGQPAEAVNPNLTEKYIRRSREERVLSICQQSKDHSFAVRFWEGIITPYRATGISQSFKKIVQWAKTTQQPRVIIGEDDLLFSAPGAWSYYLAHMPEDFDIYSGGIYSGQVEDGRIVNGYSGNTLITIHEKFYDFILQANEDAKGLGQGHLDRYLGCFAVENNYRIVQPYVVLQTQGFSDNHRRDARHQGYLQDMKLFGR